MNHDKLFVENQGLVFNMIFKTIGNYETSKDLLQDVFLKMRKAVEGGQEFDCARGFSSWLSRVAKNLSIDHLRKEKTFEILDFRMSERAISPEDQMILTETVERVEKGIEGLYINQREVVGMRVQGMKFKEISEDTGRGMNAVLSDMRYARIKLNKIK